MRCGERKAEERVRAAFASIGLHRPAPRAKVRELQQQPQLLLEWRKTNQANVALGVRGYGIGDPRRFTQHLMAVMLGGMMSSRLFVEVREKLGLAYGISTESKSDPDTGFLLTTAGVKNDSAKKAIQVILKEYRKLKTKLIPLAELTKAKEYEKGKLALQLESSNAKANFYATQELLEGEMLTPERLYDKINQVTPEDIRVLARDLFVPEKLNLALLGPYRREQEFLPLLKI